MRIRQREGFWSFRVPADGDRHRTMHSSGTFFESCDGGRHEAGVRVRVQAPGRASGTSFQVRWADGAAGDSIRYAVHYKIGQSGRFRQWKSRTSARSDTFEGRHDRTYFFQARSIRNGERTGWSPNKKVVVP